MRSRQNFIMRIESRTYMKKEHIISKENDAKSKVNLDLTKNNLEISSSNSSLEKILEENDEEYILIKTDETTLIIMFE